MFIILFHVSHRFPLVNPESLSGTYRGIFEERLKRGEDRVIICVLQELLSVRGRRISLRGNANFRKTFASAWLSVRITRKERRFQLRVANSTPPTKVTFHPRRGYNELHMEEGRQDIIFPSYVILGNWFHLFTVKGSTWRRFFRAAAK